MKAYVIIRQKNVDDYWSIEEIILNEDICDARILELNTSYEKHMKQVQKCYECNDPHDNECGTFMLRNECESANILSDRNGEYCENELSYYSHPDYFYKVETEIKNVEI